MAKSRRRGQGEGTIFQRKDGRWCGMISDGFRGGKRKRIPFYGATAKDVQDAMTDEKARIKNGEHRADASKMGLKEYSASWLKSIEKELKPNTSASYARLLDHHILPALGSKRLRAITRLNVKYLLIEKRKTLAKNTVRLIRATLSAMFAEAVDDGVLSANPAIAHSRRRGAKRGYSMTALERVKAIRPLTPDELDKVLSTAHESEPEYYPVLLTLARTGIRPGEAIALKWDDLNFEKRQVLIERAMSAGILGTTKTGTVRKVDLSGELVAALKALRVERAKQKLKDKWPEMPEWIFINRECNPLDESRLRKRFAAIMKDAKVSGHRLYDLRHGYATQLLMTGAPITYVAAQLGHSKELLSNVVDWPVMIRRPRLVRSRLTE
jgi:integrase